MNERNSPTRIALLIGALLTLIAAGCSSGASTTSPPTTPTTHVTSATGKPSTTTTPTSNAEPSLPTYSKVVATYPSGVTTCDTVANLTASGYEVTGGGIIMQNSKIVMPCYGIKVTLTTRMPVNGKAYPAGTKFTVNASMRLTPVSSWS